MTTNQYRRALKALGLSQAKAAAAFGVSPRTGQSWALGETEVHPSAAILVRLLLAGKIKLDDLH